MIEGEEKILRAADKTIENDEKATGYENKPFDDKENSMKNENKAMNGEEKMESEKELIKLDGEPDEEIASGNEEKIKSSIKDTALSNVDTIGVEVNASITEGLDNEPDETGPPDEKTDNDEDPEEQQGTQKPQEPQPDPICLSQGQPHMVFQDCPISYYDLTCDYPDLPEDNQV
jgi:hypothetical protein